MSLPVSQYEALLAEVRGLRRKAHQVQQLAAPLLLSSSSASASLCPCPPPSLTSACKISKDETLSEDTFTSSYRMESLVFQRHRGSSEYDRVAGSSEEGETAGSEEEYGNVARSATQLSVSSEPLSNRNKGLSVLYHGTWPVERPMWNSDPTNLAPPPPPPPASHYNGSEMESVISFASSSGGAPLDRVLGSPDRSRRSSQQLEAKVDMVYSLLAMLGGQEHADMGETLLALSTSSESCLAMRQSGCIPLLVQLVQSDKNSTTRKKASQALHNLVYSNPDEKQKKRESRVLKLLEQTRAYISFLRNQTDFNPEDLTISEDGDKHPVQTMAHLMKLSFDEGHRQAICHLGGIHIIASLIEVEHSEHGNNITNSHCVLLRRYGCMALTNLTFGDSGNKALLCSLKSFMFSLVSQLENTNDELCQVTASVLRNLSWRADSTSKEILREIGAVVQLMKAAMTSSKENTLKSILSALWNLSAHCSENKAEICAVEGALGFLVDMLSYKSPTKSLAIIENAGGILRNISSQIAVRDDYREILRRHSCLQILLDLLKSPSLTIVSNSCGTLWNLSAKNVQDQETLLQMGAPAMLRSLNHSKHKMIAMGSSAALRNLIASKPSHSSLVAEQLDSTAKAMDLPALPSLGARKQKALMEELDQNLAETFENIDKDSPTKSNNNNHEEKFKFEQFNKKKFNVQKSKWDAGDGEGDGDGGDVARISGSEEYNVFLSEDAASAGSRGESRNCKSDTCLDDDDDNDHLTSNFAKLNIVVDHHQLVKMNKCAANLNKIKNEFSDDCCYDEIEQVERPIDYTRKYNTTESKIIPRTTSSSSLSFVVNNNNNNNSSAAAAAAKNVTQQQLEDESFDGIYAETDLDQPTDYSLRYGEEDDSDPEDLCSQNKSHDFVSDTVKTYCTEDTPYETPFNFSTATSMSDLRDVDKQPVTTVDNNDKIKCEVDREKITGGNNNNNDNNNIIIIIDDEKDRCSVEDASEEADNKQEVDDSGSGGNKPSKSEFSSGILSPEKPVRYAEEGTPGYFSRVSSFGSLNSMPSKDGGMVIEKSTKDEIRTEHDLVKGLAKCSPQEGKVVKFDTGVNYAEETPLMFSRSSSLASLDSIDQHSIHEDRESVVSDFSRLASGVVSPSELPDSPTQTIAAPSPRRRKPSSNHDYPSTSSTCSKGMFNKLVGSKENQVVKPQPVQKSSVFEDNVTKFKEENTPVQFSTATSLSSLTFDEPDANNSNKNEKGTSVLTTNDTDTVMESAKEITEKQDVGQEKDEEEEEEEGEEGSSKNSDNLPNASESEEEDEDILAACINDGMQNNRHRQSKDNSISSRIPTSLIGYKNPLTSLRLPGSSVVVVHPVRSPTSTPVRVVADVHSDTLHNYCTEDTPAMLSYAGSHSNLSTLSTVNESPPKKDEKNDHLSDDSGSVLSADNDNNILAECIQSAMPKKPHRSKVETTAQKATTTTTSPSPFSRTRTRPESDGTTTTTITNRDNANRQNSTVCYLGAKDETERYAVENSPCHFSLRSSLSDLTIDGSVCGVTRRINNTTAEEIEEKTTKREEVNEEAGPSLLESENIIQLGLPRRDSLSSLSVESFGSTEQEQALLEQCISSGMPKNKPSQLSSNSKSSPKLAKRNYDVKEQQQQQQDDFPSKPINCKEREREREDLLLWHDEYEESKEPRHFTKTSSKNVYVTSAAGIMVPKITVGEMCPDPRATVAGGENTATEQHDLERNHRKDLQEEQVVVVVVVEEEPGTRTQDNNTLLVQRDNNRRCSLSEEKCSSIEPTKNGSNEDESGYETTRFFVDEVEEVGNGSPVNDIDIKNVKIDNRMLDPDAMIESLDRFTAELVSQAEVHLSKDNNNKSTVSTTFDGDTWNDDDDDVSSFPSVSGSAPNVVTFKSDNESPPETTPLDILDGVVKNEEEEEGEEKKSNDFSSLESNTMTESTLIAFEATKMATIIQNQSIMMSESVASVHSLELDLIEPPSQMNSLTNSLNTDHVVVVVVTPKQSPKLTKRKKILQPGLLARRALGGGYHQNQTATTTTSSSLDNLSNLDSINPPSAMCDLLDMEGSTNSIPSLTSEIADFKLDFVTSGPVTYTLDKWQPPNPIFKLKQPTTTTATIENDCDSWSGKLEHINPPSLFLNEITTDTNSCSLADVETLFEDAKNNTCVKTEEEDDDTITTTTTHYSDALNTSPMASDVAAAAAASASTSTESTPKKSKTLHKRLTPKQKRNLTRERYRTYTVAAEMVVNEEQQQKIIKMSPSVSEAPLSRAKLSPKEKRQNDRDRFQTQLLDQSLVTSVLMKMQQKDETSQLSSAEPSTSSSPPPPPPPPTSSRNRCDFVQRRLENRDRFKTRTLSESSSVSPDKSSSSPTHNEDLHSLIRREANLVVKSLNKAHTAAAAAVFDDFLDCETLSLVSNDDDSEQNYSINYRTYTKHTRVTSPPLPSSHVPTAVTTIPQEEISQRSPTPENVSDSSESSERDDPAPKTTPSKPKIIKPSEKREEEPKEECNNERVEPVKSVKGRRKPLYSPSKPIRGITSNLVRNVTSALKCSASNISIPQRERQTKKVINKPPLLLLPPPQYKKPTSSSPQPKTAPATPKRGCPTMMGGASPRAGSSGSGSANSSKMSSPVRTPTSGSIAKSISPKKNTSVVLKKTTSTISGVAKVGPIARETTSIPRTPPPPSLERQGTFTKDDKEDDNGGTSSKIPTTPPSSSSSSRAGTSRIARPISQANRTISKPQSPQVVPKGSAAPDVKVGPMKSMSADRSRRFGLPRNDHQIAFFTRSPSADGRVLMRQATVPVQGNSKSTTTTLPNRSITTSSITTTTTTTRSSTSNSSISSSNGASNSRKQQVSKIASLWKKVEEQKKNKPQKPDTRLWIQPNKP